MTGENTLSAADVAAVMGNRGGFSNSGFGGDGAWWMLILFLFAIMGGWNNNGGGNSATQFVPWMMGNQNGVQQGFDQAAIMTGLNGINTSLANAEVSRCNAQANILQTLNSNQNSVNNSMNSLAMNLQNCCCENRAATADLKYTIADSIRDAMDNCNRNSQMLMDKLCALELDGVKQRNADLLAENTALKFDNRFANQTAALEASQANQTATLLNRLNPNPVPAYVVQNPNCCANDVGAPCGYYGR